jgi:peptide/nickel transport system substrate-binding protein
MKRLVFSLAVTLLLALLAASCSNAVITPGQSSAGTSAVTSSAAKTTPASTPQPKSGGVFRLIWPQSPSVLGWPAEMSSTTAELYCLEGLLKEQVNSDLTPCLAASWNVSPDKLSITFNLRKGVKFHDGSDFNAQAAKFNFDALIAAKRQPDWKSIEIIDDYTIRVNLTRWRNFILNSFEGPNIVSPAAFQKNGIEWARLNPVGTGPFKFIEFKRDVHQLFGKFDNYWQQGKPYLDQVEVKYVQDPITQKAAMQTKEGDAMAVELGKTTFDMKALGFAQTTQAQSTFTLIFDDANADSPFYKKQVREAIEYAIDRESIASSLGYGYWKGPYQIIPRDNKAWDPNFVGRKYDPDKAKQLLTEGGYPKGFETTLIPNPDVLNKDVWVAVQSDLAKINIKLNIQYVEPVVFQKYRTGATWNNAMLADPVGAWGNYAYTFGQFFNPETVSYKSLNKSSPNWVDAYSAAANSLTADVALTRKASQALFDNCSIIPVYEGGRGYAMWPYVRDAGFNTRGFPMFWNPENAWLDK